MTDPVQRIKEVLEQYGAGVDSQGWAEGFDEALAELVEIMDEDRHNTTIRELSWCLRNPGKSIAARLDALQPNPLNNTNGEDHE